jgi:hypothetical protein
MKVKAIQISLILSIFFSILVLPIYFHYCSLVEADLFSTDLSFENPDRQNELSDYENKLRVFGPSAFSIIFLPRTNLLQQSSHFFPQALSLRKTIHPSLLRGHALFISSLAFIFDASLYAISGMHNGSFNFHRGG